MASDPADDETVQLRRVAIIDLEASGLGSASFPTEIGWATVGHDGTIASGSCLIRPSPKWTTLSNAWSAAAERLTGITIEMLHSDGLPPREALARFLEAVVGRDLYSDEPDYDAYWLGMLADAADVSFDVSKIGNAKDLIAQIGATTVFDEPPQHRAEADARRLVFAFLGNRKPSQKKIR